MNHKQRKRLISLLIVTLLVGTAAGLVLFALKKNINLFYTPTQLSLLHDSPTNSLRLGGYVKKNSIQYSHKGERVNFIITDRTHEMIVHYNGILPNLFREDQAVVVTGKLNTKKQFYASQVLAKHDEIYKPTSASNKSIKGIDYAS